MLHKLTNPKLKYWDDHVSKEKFRTLKKSVCLCLGLITAKLEHTVAVVTVLYSFRFMSFRAYCKFTTKCHFNKKKNKHNKESRKLF